MDKTSRGRTSRRVIRTDEAGHSWVARQSASGKFVVVSPAKRPKRFSASQLRQAVRKAFATQA